MPTQVYYQVRIDEDTPIGRFCDAIYYDPTTYMTLTQAQIDAAVQTRVQNWISFVQQQSSIEPVPPTVEDLQAQADQLKEQWGRLVQQMQDVGADSDQLQAVADDLASVNDAVTTAISTAPAPPIKIKLPG